MGVQTVVTELTVFDRCVGLETTLLLKTWWTAALLTGQQVGVNGQVLLGQVLLSWLFTADARALQQLLSYCRHWVGIVVVGTWTTTVVWTAGEVGVGLSDAVW